MEGKIRSQSKKGQSVSDHKGGSAGEKTALKATRVWFPQITTFLVKNKTEEKDILAAGSSGSVEKLRCLCAWGIQSRHKGDTLVITAMSQLSAPASPKILPTGQSCPCPGLTLPKGAVSIPSTKSSAHTAQLSPQCPTCHCVSAQCQGTDPPCFRQSCPWSQPSHQPASIPFPSTPKGCVTLSPTPKTRLECRDCSEEFWARGCLLQRCPQPPEKGHCGQGDLCSPTCLLWASSSPPHSPRSPQVARGASAGRSLSG